MDVMVMPSRNTLALRGVANLILGSVAVVWPQLTLLVLVTFFAFNILFTGFLMIFGPFLDKRSHHAILSVLLGLLGIVLGFYLLGLPTLTVTVLSLIIAFWAIMFGISDMYIGFANRDTNIPGLWLITLVGIASLLYGVYLLVNPLDAALTTVWLLGIYGTVSGGMLIIASFFLPKSRSKSRRR